MSIFVDDKLGSVSHRWDESADGQYVLLLAHGAGAGMEHRFMEDLATAVSQLNGHVLRFNFPYMEQGRKAPGSPKSAQHTILAAFNFIQNKHLNLPVYLSGNSYGGRMSSHLLADNPMLSVHGLVYYGFPLHAPGRDSMDRAAHLAAIEKPQLFIQGTRDKLAKYEMISQVVASQQHAEMVTIDEGDHSFKVPKRTGLGYHDVIQLLASKTNEWVLKNSAKA